METRRDASDEAKAEGDASAAAQTPAAADAAGEGGKVEEGEGKPVSSGVVSDDTDGFVHLDGMAFGMGMCCLQVTFQARDLAESLRLYDQLAVLAPVVVRFAATQSHDQFVTAVVWALFDTSGFYGLGPRSWRSLQAHRS